MQRDISKEKLSHLRDEVLALGNLAETMLMEAVDQLKRSDLDGLEQLGAHQQQVSQKRLSIEMGCLRLIAAERPLDGNLRRLVAMLEIAEELDHVGEHARRISRANFLTLDPSLRGAHMSIHRLATKVQDLLDGALEAFAQGDVGLARTTIVQFQDVDAAYGQVYHELLTVMKSKPRIANQAIYLSRAIYHLKRAAERATSICEWVLFTVTGSMEAMPAPHPQRFLKEKNILEQSAVV